MDLNQALAPVRPITSLIGTVLIVVGLLKYFGVAIGIGGAGLELAVAGFLLKNI